MRTKSTTVFTFDELSDTAKDRAREWYRNGALDYEWWDCSYEDFATIAEILGIDLRQRPVKLMNGDTRYDPAIFFSGFSSQGDGACFEGDYRYSAGSVAKIKAYAPQDTELHRIAECLRDIQRRAFYGLTASISHTGRYSHAYSMSISAECELGDCDEDGIAECLRDFANWMYSRLESEYDYLMSDESVDESCRANEYEFDKDGNIE